MTRRDDAYNQWVEQQKVRPSFPFFRISQMPDTRYCDVLAYAGLCERMRDDRNTRPTAAESDARSRLTLEARAAVSQAVLTEWRGREFEIGKMRRAQAGGP